MGGYVNRYLTKGSCSMSTRWRTEPMSEPSHVRLTFFLLSGSAEVLETRCCSLIGQKPCMWGGVSTRYLSKQYRGQTHVTFLVKNVKICKMKINPEINIRNSFQKWNRTTDWNTLFCIILCFFFCCWGCLNALAIVIYDAFMHITTAAAESYINSVKLTQWNRRYSLHWAPRFTMFTCPVFLSDWLTTYSNPIPQMQKRC